MLPKTINPGNFSNRNEFINQANDDFMTTVCDKDIREKFNGKFIYVDARDWVEDKLDIFWHIAGLEEDDQITIYPCSNDPIMLLCGRNCNTREWVVETRTKSKAVCLYRAARVTWINAILKHVNSNNSCVKVWIERGRTFIRYENGLDDFVIILEKMSKNPNMYKLVTAYPVFFISQKRNFDKQYLRYVSSENSIKK